MQRIVLAVYRQQFRARLPRGPRHKLARHNERLFVRETDAAAKFERFISGQKPHSADRSRNNNLGIRDAGDFDQPLFAKDDLGHRAYARLAESLPQFRNVRLFGHRYESRLKPRDLSSQAFEVATGGERAYREPIA